MTFAPCGAFFLGAAVGSSVLMQRGMKLPKSVVVHGFIAGADGRKMPEPENSENSILDQLATLSGLF